MIASADSEVGVKVLVIFALATFSMNRESSNATLSGVVSDPSSATVPGALIVASY